MIKILGVIVVTIVIISSLIGIFIALKFISKLFKELNNE